MRLVSHDVREHNMGLVLAALDDRGPLARAEIADETGLVRGAITTIVNDLIDIGLVRPALSTPDRPAVQVGRPMSALELDGSRFSVLAVQFGLDEVLVGAVDLGGRELLRESLSERTPVGDPEAVVDLLATTIEDARARLDAQGTPPLSLRVVAQAPVGNESESIRIAVNLGWRDVDLGGMLRARVPDLPFGMSIVNDAKMSTYAEWMRLRRAYPQVVVDDLVYLKSDTGIGGGVISGGRPLLARNGLAFEPGHQVVLRDGPACLCGQFGCLEMLAGPDVILAGAGLADFAAREGEPAALIELIARVRADDALAVESWQAAAAWIRASISGLAVLFQPQVVVVGGFWAALSDALVPEAELVRGILDAGGLVDGPAVVGSAIGKFSAIEGAVAQARHEIFRQPSWLAGRAS